ncbi:3-keto-5-aminohexanoate cleavage protein [Cupriavidus pinatubonensis]|uniref:3-keto-5-aminohexanoate cleavage protein n=1 Tax=Cupriavidus pinatubonensis TaxID=248026 RepID=UPI001FD14A8E|nr:3-keto-5-aminohexanoate cleavage protein [Cupriavidus pinatubonensis]
MPLSPDEIVEEAVACADAGASVVHFHAYDVTTGEQTTELGLVMDIIDRIRAKTDVIVYPAIRYMSNAESIAEDAGPKRYAHLDAMAAQGVAEWLIVDPGSTNLVSYRDVETRAKGLVDINSPAAIRHGLELAARHQLHPGFAIYEPGYLRLAAAFCRAMPEVPMPMYRFMFSDQLTFGFRPREYALAAYLELLREEASGSPWMIAGLGVDIRHLIPYVARSGGHVRVGLEDCPLFATQTNTMLVEEARQLIEAQGANVASPEFVRTTLFNLPA